MHPKRWLLALGAVVLAAAPLSAQPLTLGPELLVAPPSGTAHSVRVAAAPHGGFAVVWHDAQIFLRVFGADGTPLSGAVQLSAPGPGLTSVSPEIAALASGGFVVVWSDVDALPFEPLQQPRVAGRIVDATGQPVGPEIRLPAGTIAPDVAAYSSGGFVLTWLSQAFPQKSARRFDDSGTPVSGEVVVQVGENHKMATLPGGRLVMAWERLFPVPGGLDSDVLFRIFGPDLLPAGPEVRVHGQELPDNAFPQISSDATGRFVIAWKATATDTAGRQTVPQQVRARIFGPDGSAQSPEILVHTAPTLQDTNLPTAVALRSDGNFLVVWWTLSEIDLFARWYHPDGTPGGESFPIPVSPGNQFEGDAAPTAAGWVVGWDHFISDSPDSGPRIRQLSLPCPGLCLNGNRFRAEVSWRTPSGAEGTGTPIPLTGDTGAFWFFQPSNYELAVKVLDGRGVNGHFWVFFGSLTNVEFDLTVTDMATGEQRTYHNPAGTMASRADTEAFPQ